MMVMSPVAPMVAVMPPMMMPVMTAEIRMTAMMPTAMAVMPAAVVAAAMMATVVAAVMTAMVPAVFRERHIRHGEGAERQRRDADYEFSHRLFSSTHFFSRK